MATLTAHDLPLLAGCTAQQVHQGLARFRPSRVDAGTVLIGESEVGREFFLILSGTVAVSSGGRFVRMLAGPTFVGEEAMLGLGPRSATITALTPCDMLVAGQLGFDELLQLPGVGAQIRAAVAARSTERIADAHTSGRLTA